MHQQHHHQHVGGSQQPSTGDTVEKLLRQAEISRLTRNLKSKLALASLKTQKSPVTTPVSEQKRRPKTLEGALPSPRPNETPITRPRSNSRRSSVTSISSVSSLGSTSALASPRARIPRISSVGSISEVFNEGNTKSTPLFHHNTRSPLQQYTPQKGKPQQTAFPYYDNDSQHDTKAPSRRLDEDEEPLPREPQTPPSAKRGFPKTPERSSSSDGANLLLHFAHSPGRATPRTPDFNMNDYLHFQTPSPARGQLTPQHMRWGSLNSALFQPAGPVMMPSRPAGYGFDDEKSS